MLSPSCLLLSPPICSLASTSLATICKKVSWASTSSSPALVAASCPYRCTGTITAPPPAPPPHCRPYTL